MSKILLTGASGYIGGNLLKSLKDDNEIVAITRNTKNKEDSDNVTWKSADLFSYDDINRVMEGVDIAVYLVHSMMPSSSNTIANFEDMDAILADNFAKAAKANGVKHIIYMSGLIPKDGNLSPHLRSRLECEEILGSYGVPVSTLRAGLIVGVKGSSYPILKKLVERLPVLPLPKWAYHKMLPVSIEDVISGLTKLTKRFPSKNESIDIGGQDHMTYKDLFTKTAKVLNKRIFMFDLPIVPVWLSKFWVSLITGENKEMVYPLMESLVHDMERSPENTVDSISYGKISFEESVKSAYDGEKEMNRKKAYDNISGNKIIQRVQLPENEPLSKVADRYFITMKAMSMSSNMMSFDSNQFSVKIPFTNKTLLHVTKSDENEENRYLEYRLKGGEHAVSDDGGEAVLTFRRIMDKDEVLMVLEEVYPTLPLAVYQLSYKKFYLYFMLIVKFYNKIIRFKPLQRLSLA
ncbi:NAD(P)H-binding protein [Staphylococcus massiliensis]|uniref:NAD(P)-binding domain-containing protein n=1 Tax=Staphylococcus massiliensis S46 TaxID=1229783 RepID=K9ASK1_9STAP|nr:NAD(P)H-binding protein [Staphylococcus massiliensis]EKU49051.1 hypothetical protein C273_04580 [Staphylococcus massiliensis S46]MCG3402408.1 NAD(P)H-binding protein [Staphylococcus massiliensis]MCG3411628.1 NAD(P)H-binding protein [Staphylococcus massiliensis]